MMSNRKGIINIPSLCSEHELNHIVISPGSRNAPLIISFLKHPGIKCYSIPDERSAGYFAIGLSLYLNKPVGLVCTSGTATLNLSPSIAEAFYQNLPIVIFTADRPPEWIDQEDGQTINQYNIYKNYIKRFYQYPVSITDDDDLWYANRIISSAIEEAKTFPSGPVHINIPLKEPLYDDISEYERISINKSIKIEIPKINIDDAYKKLLSEQINKFRKIIIINGFGNKNNELNNELIRIHRNKQAIVIAENISNLTCEDFISTPESFFTLYEQLPNNYYPDLLITTGNSVVSKKMKQFFRRIKKIEHWRINPNIPFSDTYQHLTKEIKIPPEIFFKIFAENYKTDKETFSFHEKLSDIKQNLHTISNKIFEELPYSDLKSLKFILDNIPKNSTVFFSNSTPIRYSQLIKARTDLFYYCNRGTSGIDGCLSSAIGYSVLSKNPTFIIIGDVAFIYDSNALWNNYKNNIKIILMNNSGGNIFRLIQNYHEYENVKDFFETNINVSYKEIAKAFELNYFFCNNFEQLKLTFLDFVSSEKSAILEIKTSPEINYSTYNEYFKKLLIYGKN